MFPKWLYDMQIEAPDLFMCLNSHWDRVFKNTFTWAPTSAKPKVGTGKCSGKSGQPTWYGPHHPSGALKYLLNMLLGAQKNCPSIVLFQTASDWWVSLSFSHGEYFINVSHSAKLFFFNLKTKFANKNLAMAFTIWHTWVFYAVVQTGSTWRWWCWPYWPLTCHWSRRHHWRHRLTCQG